MDLSTHTYLLQLEFTSCACEVSAWAGLKPSPHDGADKHSAEEASTQDLQFDTSV
jgi:hypothetical protein